jgi:hypothetical protein
MRKWQPWSSLRSSTPSLRNSAPAYLFPGDHGLRCSWRTALLQRPEPGPAPDMRPRASRRPCDAVSWLSVVDSKCKVLESLVRQRMIMILDLQVCLVLKTSQVTCWCLSTDLRPAISETGLKFYDGRTLQRRVQNVDSAIKRPAIFMILSWPPICTSSRWHTQRPY